MSPFKTLNNSGSSSREVDLQNLPIEVILSQSGSRQPSASRALVIVLNLYIQKDLPCSPGRICLKNTGEPILTRTKTAMINIKKDNKKNKCTHYKIKKALHTPVNLQLCMCWSFYL